MSNMAPAPMQEAGTTRHRRHRRWWMVTAGVGLTVVVAAAVALAVGLGGGRSGRAQEPASIAPLVTGGGSIDGPGPEQQQPPPSIPDSSAVGALEPQQTRGPTKAAGPAGTVASSTQEALGKLTEAVAAAVAVAGGGADKQQQEQGLDSGAVGTCRVQNAEELTDAVEVRKGNKAKRGQEGGEAADADTWAADSCPHAPSHHTLIE